MTSVWNSAKGAIGGLASGIGNGLSAVGTGIGDGLSAMGGLFGSGNQPVSGTPNSSGATLSQSTPDIPDVSGGADTSSLSAAGVASPGFDLSSLSSGGTSALDQMLNGLSATDSAIPVASAPSLTNSAIDSIRGYSVAPSAATSATATPTAPGGGLLRSVVPALTMAYSIYKGNQTPPEVKAMNKLASDALARSGSLNAGAEQAMQGHLPGGAQASIDQALESVKAQIRSKYAALGMTGSTPEMQDLAYAELAASAQAFQIGQNMAQTGFQAAAGADSLSAQLYANILQAETARGTALGDALAEFAAGTVDNGGTVGAHPHG